MAEDDEDGVMLMAPEPPDESDASTHGFNTDTGTDTESVASSFASARNKKKKDRKKKAAAARKAEQAAAAATGAASGGAGSSSNDDGGGNGVSVEYVSARDDVLGNEAFAELADVFGKFATAEQLLSDAAAGPADGADAGGAEKPAKASVVAATGAEGDEGKELSKRKKKHMQRLSIAELKQLVPKPEVVEAWDVTSLDPRLLVQLKSCRNAIPVPKHWAQKRKFLMGKRGVEKPPFQLPDFIAATGIERIRASVLEKEQAKKLKGKQKERMQPKMGKIDIDYQVLHDAFFKFQTKPMLTKHGDVYYEGKEHEAHLRAKRPGHVSAELSTALDIPAGGPPPWLVNMQRYGPPPSYANLKIPGLNAPIPEGTSYGYHAGGWGKPPVDEFGRPLYGDVFGTAEGEKGEERLEPGLSKEAWGAMDEDEEEEDEEEEDDDEGGDGGSIAATDDDLADGIASVSSTAPSGLATPDAIQLRKQVADGLGTPSAMSSGTGGLDTPDSTVGQPQLYQVLQQTDSKIGSSAFGSTHGYVVPPPPPPGIGTQGGSNNTSGKKLGKGAPADGGVELALDPAELEHLDEAALKQRYEQLRQAERAANAGEDVSDIIEEQERKRARRAAAQEKKR